MNFTEWMQEVDNRIAAICGLGHEDLGDALYADMFEDGVSPKEAAQEVLEAEGFPFE